MMKRTEVFSRPSVVDITIAVARVNAGDWFDPYEHDDEPLDEIRRDRMCSCQNRREANCAGDAF